jgi:hypothetical protein
VMGNFSNIWRFPENGVPLNFKSSISKGISMINQPFWGSPIYGTPYIYTYIYMYIYNIKI